jgi:hypothetical protein
MYTPDPNKPVIVLRQLNEPPIADGLRKRVKVMTKSALADELFATLKASILTSYMVIDTIKLGEKGDLADAIRQADSQLTFGRAAIDEYYRRKTKGKETRAFVDWPRSRS